MPESVEAHFNLGMTYLKLGNRVEALIEYELIKDKNPGLAATLHRTIYKDKLIDLRDN
ncbi:MAG TPA: tetratricopeptide repeat protein [Pyrinomonadaceae bacterium]|nr:tetratricopeptide repeat protein [Pyrinomonadaceae bacterium]